MRWPITVLAIVATISVAGCQGQPTAALSKAGCTRPAGISGDTSSGRQLFLARGCVACHRAKSVPQATGTIGPDLTGIDDAARRPMLAGNQLANTPENVRRWIMDPQGVKPGTPMPNLDLTDKEADDLVALLYTLC